MNFYKINKNKRIVLAMFAVVLAIFTGYFLNKIYSKKVLTSQDANIEAKDLAETVGKLITLPIDEVPTIATVSDPNALKDQPFFIDAKFGYKVLIYAKAKKAILYDPVLNKIVNVAPFTVGENPQP